MCMCVCVGGGGVRRVALRCKTKLLGYRMCVCVCGGGGARARALTHARARRAPQLIFWAVGCDTDETSRNNKRLSKSKQRSGSAKQ
jgi:hypothetical protein